ncbi:hypothetical protein G3580_16935 [Nitrogeniibacter mangrovi]|uniref:Bacterial CdiA-CT RNAse A domain-containing protein n=1 Tax=Nitrogeniibacter mangrovi TaxID=2016596 RepID=A0A6C1B8J9_9RHOO|nr:RNase A-like domain-containing protein [Nitrogeniibacter mangrovi]QID19155.1 hypothetical protein G3580_16935 [Nitrogeniibacter mangrovi]
MPPFQPALRVVVFFFEMKNPSAMWTYKFIWNIVSARVHRRAQDQCVQIGLPSLHAGSENGVEQEGLTLALTPPQLAAVLANGTLEEPSFSNRAWGTASAIFGALEVLGGGALLLIPEPTTLTKVSGGALGLHGIDTFQAGVRQAWTGREKDTFTSDGTTALAQLLGVDEETAERIGDGVDLAVPLIVASALAAARIVAVRAGKISLAGHEAQGGHTIARHVARTEEQLRARLVAQARIPAASSFETLAQAEKAVSAGLRANRMAIALWAETAAPNAKRAFDWTASGKIGHGVVRATGRLTPMSKVRIVLQKKAVAGKLYYILTAFPIP